MAKSSNHPPPKAQGEVIWGVRFGMQKAQAQAAAIATMDFGSGWYHEAALKEAERATVSPKDGRKPH